MPRGIKNQQSAPQAQLSGPTTAPKSSAADDLARRLKPTKLNHVFYFDVNGDGKFREVAVVKMAKDAQGKVRSVYYIDVQLCDQIDKGRIKAAVTSVHADKYELWDLLSQTTLNNGKNGLDYFHQITKVVHGPGAVNTTMGGGLSMAQAETNQMVGSEFTDPGSAVVDPTMPNA